MVIHDEVLTRSAIGSFYEVYNTLGYGLIENPYVGALVIELTDRGLRVEREVSIAVEYKGKIVGSYRADLLVEGRLLIEVKADAALIAPHERQLRNYLSCSNIEIGLLFNFGIKPEFRRFIHTRDRKRNHQEKESVQFPSNPR